MPNIENSRGKKEKEKKESLAALQMKADVIGLPC